MTRPALLLLALALVVAGCGGRRPPSGPVERGWEERGLASWYGPGFHGRHTANGEIYDMDGLTAAHKTLPFDTVVEVRNLENGRTVRVRINDRGPFVRGRIIDLSRRAAREIGLVGPGVAEVRVRVIQGNGRAARAGSASWLVQAGAFRERDRALALAERLRAAYPSVRVETAGGWHRVALGPYGRRSRAEDTASALRRQGVEAIVRGSG